MSGVRKQLAESAAAFGAVAKNPNLRRLQAGFAASIVGHWAYAVAVSVYAFQVDGTTAVGIVWLIRMVPAALVSPFAALLADRFPQERVMLASDLARAGLIGAAAAAAWAHAPSSVVYALAGLVAISATPFQPASSSLVPSLVTTPAELCAANVTSSSIESIGFFAGPALAGLLLGITSPAAVFAMTAALMVLSALFVGGVRSPRERPVMTAESGGRIAWDCLAGFRSLALDPRLRILVGLLAATMLVIGALEVLTVVAAMRLLGFGESGVGYLNSAFGVGALVGAVTAATFVGARRLSLPFIGGALLWGFAVALVGAFASPAMAIVLFGFVGAGNTLIDVAGLTLIQRAVPSEVLARVFGVLQMIWLGAIGVGAALGPLLIHAFGIRGAFVAAGCFVSMLVAVFGLRLIRIDRAAPAPEKSLLALLQGIRTFAPLPGTTLERLVARLTPMQTGDGTEIIREGDHADRFYVIADGRVAVSADGKPVASLGPGEGFGEIALLRDVPRTATVRTEGQVSLYALERDDFLAAVTGHPPAARAAESVIGARLAALQSERIAAPTF